MLYLQYDSVTHAQIPLTDMLLKKLLILTKGDSKFVSATYRLFKTGKKPDEKCCCSVKYKGLLIGGNNIFGLSVSQGIKNWY